LQFGFSSLPSQLSLVSLLSALQNLAALISSVPVFVFRVYVILPQNTFNVVLEGGLEKD
jgi:hypothetical protein